MDWHRDGQGGYVGEHTDHDADATIKRVTPLAHSKQTMWEVTTRVFGREVDVATIPRLADAKWHADAVVSVCAMGPQR